MTDESAEMPRGEASEEAGSAIPQPPDLPIQPPFEPPAAAAPPPPTGTYALGALAGNPRLAAPGGSGYGGPPTAPGFDFAPPPPPPEAHQPRRHRVRKGAAVAGAALIALAGGIGIGDAVWNNSTSSLSTSPASNGSTPGSGSQTSPFGSGNGGFGFPFGSGNPGPSGPPNHSGPSDVSAIAAKVDPGLVDINTTLGYAQEQAAGTGIVLTSSGEVLTNNHVVEGATSISVTDVGNGKTYTASVVGYDRTQDIAVLQLHNASGLQTASIGNSANVSVGEQVVGIGNAGGTGGTPSAAGGTVTALNQSITASDQGDSSSEQLTGLIQTNADIQPGDSGGALVSTSGQVVGVDTAASAGFSFQSSANQGYAIPINEAVSIARQIEAGKASSTVHIGSTAFLGVFVQSPSNANGFGGDNGGGTFTSGAAIASVVTSSPAQQAGLAGGDTITSVDGKTVTSAEDLTNLLAPFHPGDKVTIGWTDSSGQSHTARIQLSSGPPQ